MKLSRSERRDHGQPERDTATACRNAHNEGSRFFDWTGSSDCYMANAWRQKCTAMIVAGSTADDAVAAIKSWWLDRCKRLRVKPRMEPISNECATRYLEIRDLARDGLKPWMVAVMYRSIARDFPEAAVNASFWAGQLEAMGDTWKDLPFSECGFKNADGGSAW